MSAQEGGGTKDRSGVAGLQRAIATVSLGGSLAARFKAIARAGFDGVELVERDLLAFCGTARNVREMAESLGLKIIVYQPLRNLEGCPRSEWQKRLDAAERMLDVMHELNAETLLLCSNESDDTIADEDVMAEDLRCLAERAGLRGRRVGYEALSWSHRINTYAAAWRLVQKASSKHLGLVLDSFHTCCLNDDLSMLKSIPAERIFLVQIADAPRLRMQVIEWSRRYRCFPGLGDFDLQDFLLPILMNGYRGPLSLEIFSDQYVSKPPMVVANEGIKSLQNLEQAVLQFESARK